MKKVIGFLSESGRIYQQKSDALRDDYEHKKSDFFGDLFTSATDMKAYGDNFEKVYPTPFKALCESLIEGGVQDFIDCPKNVTRPINIRKLSRKLWALRKLYHDIQMEEDIPF